MIERNNCSICNGSELENIITLESFPIYMGSTSFQDEIRMDQEWVVCKGCGCVQLKKLVDLDVLYKVPHNPAVGKTWESHNSLFSEFVQRNCGEIILEIGGGNFKISNLINKDDFKDYCVYDSHIYLDAPENVRFVESFINQDDFNDDSKYDTIIMSHVFEHFYEPRKFVELFSNILQEGWRVIISFPNSTNMIRDFYPNGLCFEHTYQLDMDFIKMVMTEFGFELVDHESFGSHNEFVCFEKLKDSCKIIRVNKYDGSKSDFIEFISANRNIADLISTISIYSYSSIYLFGCHIFSQFLIESGLDGKRIKGILDNDTSKQGDTLFGTDIKVYSPNVIKGLDGVLVVVKCGIYSIEIAKQLKSINPKCDIIL